MAYGGNYSFEGLDARRAASDGAIRDMTNMSLRFYPAIASRTPRRTVGAWGTGFGGVYFGDREFVVRGGVLYDDDTYVAALTPGEKQMAVLESTLYIFPDKITYHTEDRTLRDYAAETISNEGAIYDGDITVKQDDTYEGERVDALYLRSAKYDYKFRDGEIIQLKISKAVVGGYLREPTFETVQAPKTDTITDSGGVVWRRLIYPAGTFDPIKPGTFDPIKPGFNGGIDRVEAVIEHAIPDMDFVFASDNRLWGAKGRNIYASSLGNGMEWMDYDTLTTSSWAASTATGDKITAAVDFGGMPVFFAERAVYKVYGENPKEYQYARSEIIGVMEGEHKSVAVGAGYIFYLSRRGVYAWTGGIPQMISAKLGEERLLHGVGGSDGAVYYLSAEQGGRNSLFVYDTMTNAWMREDGARAVWIGMRGQNLCMVSDEGLVMLIGDVIGEEGDAEYGITYALETADYNDGTPLNKYAKHILIQYELTDGEAEVLVSHDGEPWRSVYTLYDTDGKKITSVIPLHPGSYRTMRIQIVGCGDMILYYMVREVAATTERPGGEKNVYV